MENYQTEVLKTLANADTYEEYVNQDLLIDAFEDFCYAANTLEIFKKHIAYGKNIPDEPVSGSLPKQSDHILHAKLGIAGESGEVILAQTRDEVKKEAGDLLWYLAVLLKEYELDFPEVMEANIAKLRERYSTGKFTREEALNRADMAGN